MGLPLGVVLGTKGVERHIITFHGQEAHSGSTPMNARRDALAAAAKLALEIRTIAKKHDDAVCTVGSVKTSPGIATAVVGRCEVTLDQRDLDANVLAEMHREAQDASQRFAAEEHCTVDCRASGTSNPCCSILNYWICASRPFGKLRVLRIACRQVHCTTLLKFHARDSYGYDVRAVAQRHQPQQKLKIRRKSTSECR